MTATDWGRPNTGQRGKAPVVVLAVVAVIVVGALAAGAVVFGPELLSSDDGDASGADGTEPAGDPAALQQEAEQALSAFAAALEANDLSQVEFARVTTPLVVGDYESLTGGLAPFTIAAEEGPVTLSGETMARAPIELAWTLDERVEWATSSDVELEQIDGEWLVRWAPSILEPSLLSGDELVWSRISPGRGSILGRGGAVLVDDFPVVHVGIQPQRVEDLGALVQRLEEVLGIDPDELAARVAAAAPDAFVEVTTLRQDDYEAVRDEIFPLPGTVFQDGSQSSALSDTFARALLGRSGEVTAEIIEENPGLFEPGDIAGISGLQATYNEALAGQPGAEISVIRAPLDPSSTTTGTGLTTTSSVRRANQPEVLATIDPVEGEPVVTTIDPAVQIAAEAALEATELPSALVAIEVSTGEILAVANGPTGATVNFAMTGQYPPGSIFKVVTGYALLRDQLGAEDPAECPQTITIEGRSFANAEDEVLGTVSFRSAFAHSCNTAFVGLTTGFAPEVLHDSAADFGLGVTYDAGEAAFTGSVPVADSRVDLASSAFGQGRVLVSPLSAAVMAATAADGVFRSPRLVVSPELEPQVVSELEPGPAATLRELMRAVVTEGTGRAVIGVPGPPVHGKTGTAEFGNQNPPQSHAWFVGFQGDVAFAVLVEAGEFGGSTAAPIAGRFLTSLQEQGLGAGGDGSTTTTPEEGSDEPEDGSDPPDDTTETTGDGG
jgi:cell division protein FtsI/penicillin-binding protein 2